MRPQHADGFRLAVVDGQVVIEFGRVDEVRGVRTMALSDRITLPPETAARMLHGLREALQQRATTALAEEGTDSLAGPQGAGATPLNLPPDPAGEQASRLLALVAGLGVPYQYERSFRLAPGSLQANRFLTTMNRADLGADALERVLAVARAMGLPSTEREAVAARFDAAQSVHFGFEAGGGAMRCKLYLERRVPADEAAAAAAQGRVVPLHHAFKWDVLSGEGVQTVYDWHPGLDAAGIAARLRALYGADEAPDNAASLAIALDTLALASPRAGQLQYLEVHEPETSRRSFDINLYDANLAVRDALPLLLRMRERHGVRPGQFQALVDQVKGLPLGHLAGGVHRDGRDFFNVYYGVAGFPRFATARD